VRALLDVNVLIALHDPQHVHHALAVDWLVAHAADGWASCPITQNGCLRVMSQPAYPQARGVAELIDLLGGSFRAPTHQFWPDDISLFTGSTLRKGTVLGHRQLTDAYLLALAVAHGGRFVSFDRAIAVGSVSGAGKEHLVSLLSA
jgi:uncharacterized protein